MAAAKASKTSDASDSIWRFFCQRFHRSTLETERFDNDFFSAVFKTPQFGILCGGFRRLSAAFAVIQVSTIGENVSKK